MEFTFAKIAVLMAFTALSCAVKTQEKIDGYQLVWSDEFDYEGLPDAGKWGYDVGDACDKPQGCGWGNNELQYYTEKKLKNARVEDGKLTIEVHREDIGNAKYSSARLVTKGKAEWKYGRIVTRAKLPIGKGVWSAIWMLSANNKYGGWPHSGEIDIMENVGFDPDTIVGSAHTLAYHHSIGTHKNGKFSVPDNDEKFHDYVLEWEPDQYRIYVDDTLFFTFKNEKTGFEAWPFDQPFYLILNIAYGGNWGGEKGLDESKLPQKMEVDYVRVYQKDNTH